MNESASASPPPRPPRWRSIMGWSIFLIPVLFALSQPLIWNVWTPSWGVSEKYVVTYGQIVLGTILLLLWWFLFAPVPRRLRWGIGIPVLLGIAGWIAVQRMPELSGDMQLTFHYRWEPAPAKAFDDSRWKAGSIDEPAKERVLSELQPEDMPSYRGIHRDGIVTGPAILKDWKENPPRELWRRPVGGGYASISIQGDDLVTLEQRGPDEAVVCYSAGTGEQIWEYRYPADFFEAMGGRGPRSTPTIAGDAVYSFGAFGDLCCLDRMTGKPRWQVNSLQQFHLANTDWGMCCSPLVYEDRVIVNVGGAKGNGLIAYRLLDGSVFWYSAGLSRPTPKGTQSETGSRAMPTDGTTKSVPGYASPQLATIAGELQILNLDGKALRGNQLETGKELWSVPFENQPHVNVAQPLVFEDGRILLCASYDVGAKMVKVTREQEHWHVEDLWANRNLRCKFTSPVFVDRFVYGLDEGILACIDPESGKRMWKGGKSGLRGRYQHGQLLATHDLILALSEQGEAVLVQANPKQLKELAVLRVLPESKTWNPPALSRGLLYVRNESEMACFDLRAATPAEVASISPL